MIKSMRLYPPVQATGKSFKKCKKVVVPHQSLSLRQIIDRFTRNEKLPVGKDGIYNERIGDIEKMSTRDITEQMAVAENLKSKIAEGRKRVSDKKAKEEAAALEKAVAEKLKQKAVESPPPAPTP